ncbi:hypothetical protein QFC20_005430 [Naganishia adeliensis]|uniref:Uncharacterized protein n=1 Tax=Naganishia adeliensis TaxID=92952 RepID=A0ACC2VMY9_9TREE|nr:hypothetical protein QFC20_005430 [Naganishia adeliensis]
MTTCKEREVTAPKEKITSDEGIASDVTKHGVTMTVSNDPRPPPHDKKMKKRTKVGESDDELEKRVEKWEDDVNMVLGILRKSLGDHRSMVKNITDPLTAYETITKQYSGETEYDIIDLMQRFAITTPKGDDLLGYLNEMQHLQTTLNTLDISYTDTQLIGTMLYQLKRYESGHPFRTLYNDLSFKYKDKPSEVTMALFRRFAKSTIREVTLDVRDAADHVKVEADTGSALAIRKGMNKTGYGRWCSSAKVPNMNTKTAPIQNSTPDGRINNVNPKRESPSSIGMTRGRLPERTL